MGTVPFWISLGLLFISLSLITALRLGFSNLSYVRIRDRAQKGNADAKRIYPFFAQKERLEVVMTTLAVVFQLGIAALMWAELAIFMAFLVSFLLFVGAEIIARAYLQHYAGFFLARLAPIFRKLIIITALYNKPMALLLRRKSLFPKKQMGRVELLEIIQDQIGSNGGGITKTEKHAIEAILQFSAKTVSEVMTPRREAKILFQDDEIGPVLMDELYGSGYSRFPVMAGPKNEVFVGTLYLRDLVISQDQKKVKEVMIHDVRYVHEDQNLEHALNAFLRTRHHLFVVVNSFEEFVGLISIEDVLESLIGSEIIDEFDEHDDMRKVAALYAKKEHQHHASQESEKSE